MKSIYDYPFAYAQVLQKPAEEIHTEADTLLKILEEFGLSQGRMLELACGAMPHGILLAAAGWQLTGIDRSEAMLQQARQAAKQHNLEICALNADVIDFQLKQKGYDAAIFLFETFPLIADLTDLESHFDSVGRHLRSGGMYIFDVDEVKLPGTEANEEGDHKVIQTKQGRIEYWNEDLPSRPMEGVIRLALHTLLTSDGEQIRTKDEWTVRAWSPFTLELLARSLPGWEYLGCRNWTDGSKHIGDEKHCFVVFRRI